MEQKGNCNARAHPQGDRPSERPFEAADVDVREAWFQPKQDNLHQYEGESEGLYFDVDEEEGLKLLDFILANRQSLPNLVIPVKSRNPDQWNQVMASHQPIGLEVLGFCKYALAKSGNLCLQEPFRLELNQLPGITKA